MARLLTLLLVVVCADLCIGQQISGQVINEATKESLPFVTISVINTRSGTITNENGFFKLDARSLSPEAKVQVSMIGFEPQILQIKNLIGSENIIRLKEHTVRLNEVIVRPKKVQPTTMGTKTSSRKNVTGWGGCGNCGEDIGGVERGILININKAVFVEKVNFHVAYFGYDSMLLRLHIRKVENDYPTEELLTTNIYSKVKATGWQEIDLTKYNLSLSQDVAVSLEWVKAWGKKKDLENSLKLSVALFKGTMFAKDGMGDKWDLQKPVSPGIYLTVEGL